MSYALNKTNIFLKLILPTLATFFLSLLLKINLIAGETWRAFQKSALTYSSLLVIILCLVMIQQAFKKTYLTLIIGLVSLAIFLFAFETAFRTHF